MTNAYRERVSKTYIDCLEDSEHVHAVLLAPSNLRSHGPLAELRRSYASDSATPHQAKGTKRKVGSMTPTRLLTSEAGPLAPEPDRKTIVGSLSELEAPSGTLTQ